MRRSTQNMQRVLIPTLAGLLLLGGLFTGPAAAGNATTGVGVVEYVTAHPDGLGTLVVFRGLPAAFQIRPSTRMTGFMTAPAATDVQGIAAMLNGVKVLVSWTGADDGGVMLASIEPYNDATPAPAGTLFLGAGSIGVYGTKNAPVTTVRPAGRTPDAGR